MKLKNLMEAKGSVYAATFDSGDGEYLGTVGPFESDEEAKNWFDDNKVLEDIRYEIDEVVSPQDYIESFSGDH